MSSPSRDLSVAVFVVWQGKLLLHKHKKLARWLPCGGHVEPNELPDDAAVREVLEESGVSTELVGERVLVVANPKQLVRPRGVQLATISQGHEHIDLIYYAKPVAGYDGSLSASDPTLGWYDRAALTTLELTDEISQWAALVLREMA